MKDKEKLYKDFMSRFDALNPPHMKDAFMAGMEAARPQWHYLCDNPKDLPEFCGYESTGCMAVMKRVIRNYNNIFAFYDFIAKAWYSYDNLEYLEDVVAWCELPEWKGGVQ